MYEHIYICGLHRVGSPNRSARRVTAGAGGNVRPLWQRALSRGLSLGSSESIHYAIVDPCSGTPHTFDAAEDSCAQKNSHALLLDIIFNGWRAVLTNLVVGILDSILHAVRGGA